VKKVLAIAFAVVADAARRKVVWVVIVFAAILAVAIPALPSYGEGVASAVFREVSIALMYMAALVVALSLAVTRIPVEIERRTVFNVITRDVRRWQYVAGTWIGMFAVLGLVVAAFSVASIGIGAFTYGELMWRLFEASFAVWLEIGIVMAFAVMLSCSFGAVTSSVGALAFAFVGHAVVGLTKLPEGVRPPWYVPTLDVFNVINPVAHGTGYGPIYAASMVVVFIAWIALLLLGGAALFSRRDI
jgi:ABC-type transport system involved in multi-copper enzyme maturation permease subunit